MFLLKISHDQNVTAEHFEGGEHFELSATHEKLKLPKGQKEKELLWRNFLT